MEFSRDKKQKDGLHRWCKRCNHNAYIRSRDNKANKGHEKRRENLIVNHWMNDAPVEQTDERGKLVAEIAVLHDKMCRAIPETYQTPLYDALHGLSVSTLKDVYGAIRQDAMMVAKRARYVA